MVSTDFTLLSPHFVHKLAMVQIQLTTTIARYPHYEDCPTCRCENHALARAIDKRAIEETIKTLDLIDRKAYGVSKNAVGNLLNESGYQHVLDL